MKERDWVDWTSFSNQLAQTRILEQQSRHMGELASIERARLRLEESREFDAIIERFTGRYATREVEKKFDLVSLLMNRFESSEPIPNRSAFKESVSTSIEFVSEVKGAAARALGEIDALLVVSLTKESRDTWTTQIRFAETGDLPHDQRAED